MGNKIAGKGPVLSLSSSTRLHYFGDSRAAVLNTALVIHHFFTELECIALSAGIIL